MWLAFFLESKEDIKVEYQYGPKIDKHIYISEGGGCETKRDWMQLALAALDQSGMSLEKQQQIADMICDVDESETIAIIRRL